jgi:regulator of ribonuclease activity A
MIALVLLVEAGDDGEDALVEHASRVPQYRRAVPPLSTADTCDEHGDRATVCESAFRQFGGVRHFAGAIATVRCEDDNVLLREQISGPGDGRVLVVDGGGSLRSALVGDMLAQLALDNGWAGLVINGAVRDSSALAGLRIGVTALGTCPRRSAKQGRGEVDVPVSFAGATFAPGDTVVADEDGVVVLPA